MTHNLAKNLALLYSKGYGDSAELVEDQFVSQNAAGTGIGEGTGVNDVSDQITDEDQLLGDSSKVKTKLPFVVCTLRLYLSILCTTIYCYCRWMKREMPQVSSQIRMIKESRWSRILKLICLV